jgi:hypothetical protein
MSSYDLISLSDRLVLDKHTHVGAVNREGTAGTDPRPLYKKSAAEAEREKHVRGEFWAAAASIAFRNG